MRYVIAVCVVTGLLIWDLRSNDGRYLDQTISLLHQALRYFGA